MNYFITFADVSAQYMVSGNAYQDDVMPYARHTYNEQVEPILGANFGSYLLGKYNANTLTANELILVDKCRDIIGWGMVRDVAISTTFAIKNKGIQTQNGEFNESVAVREVGFVTNHYNEKMNNSIVRLQEYLEENYSLFPQYVRTCNDDIINFGIMFI